MDFEFEKKKLYTLVYKRLFLCIMHIVPFGGDLEVLEKLLSCK